MVISILSVLVTYFICRKLKLFPKSIVICPYQFMLYVLWLMKEIIKSSIAVSKICWGRGSEITPIYAWIGMKQQCDVGKVIYANSITLTPGTVTIAIKSNKLLVHSITKSSITELKAGVLEHNINKVTK